MLHHGRHGALATAVVIAFALIAPASALAGHDLVIYKKEAQVDLEADEKTVSVGCETGDHALDGMWRIDHADQDDYLDDLDNVVSAVDVLRATPTSGSTYSFTFVKNAIGRAQAKVFVTCLADKTQGGAHQHAFTPAMTDTTGTAGQFNSQVTPVTGTGALLKTPIATNASCPDGARLVSPGFEAKDFTDGAVVPTAADPPAGIMRLYESTSADARSWSWRFENSALASGYDMNIETKWRCLKVKVPTSASAPDKHKLTFKYKSPVTFNPKAKRASEGRYTCGAQYKAIVAGFSIPENAADAASYLSGGDGLNTSLVPATAFNSVFYLGMDPRPKQRAFRFANRSASNAWGVTLRALCINYRTT